jgi:hypothetical protein
LGYNNAAVGVLHKACSCQQQTVTLHRLCRLLSKCCKHRAGVVLVVVQQLRLRCINRTLAASRRSASIRTRAQCGGCSKRSAAARLARVAPECDSAGHTVSIASARAADAGGFIMPAIKQQHCCCCSHCCCSSCSWSPSGAGHSALARYTHLD